MLGRARRPLLVHRHKKGYSTRVNQRLKAIVHDGHIVLKEPTNLPEGAVVNIMIVRDEVDFAEPWMDKEEAKAFNKAMRASIADEEAGRVVDGDVVLADLRARAQAS